MRNVLGIITHSKNARAPERCWRVIAEQPCGEREDNVHATGSMLSHDERNMTNSARQHHADARHHRATPYSMGYSAFCVIFRFCRHVNGVLPDGSVGVHPLRATTHGIARSVSGTRNRAVERIGSLTVARPSVICAVHALRDLVIDIESGNPIMDERSDMSDIPDVPAIPTIRYETCIELHRPKHCDHRA